MSVVDLDQGMESEVWTDYTEKSTQDLFQHMSSNCQTQFLAKTSILISGHDSACLGYLSNSGVSPGNPKSGMLTVNVYTEIMFLSFLRKAKVNSEVKISSIMLMKPKDKRI